MIERRSKSFIERLSTMLILGAFVGGFIVLLDIKFTLTLWGQVVSIGGTSYSPDVKGMVLQSMLITGFAAVVGFWLGTTKQGQEQAQSVSRIAESVPVAAAVAASVLPVAGTQMKTDAVNVDATGGDVTIVDGDRKT